MRPSLLVPSVWTQALLGLLLLAPGCVGSPRPRNPNVQRRDPEAEKKPASTFVRVKKLRPLRAEDTIGVIDLPANAWAEHDRDLYRALGEAEARKVKPVPTWFKIETQPKAEERFGERKKGKAKEE